MELREQFEKETGGKTKEEIHLYEGFTDECFSDKYVEWLEERVKVWLLNAKKTG